MCSSSKSVRLARVVVFGLSLTISLSPGWFGVHALCAESSHGAPFPGEDVTVERAPIHGRHRGPQPAVLPVLKATFAHPFADPGCSDVLVFRTSRSNRTAGRAPSRGEFPQPVFSQVSPVSPGQWHPIARCPTGEQPPQVRRPAEIFFANTTVLLC